MPRKASRHAATSWKPAAWTMLAIMKTSVETNATLPSTIRSRRSNCLEVKSLAKGVVIGCSACQTKRLSRRRPNTTIPTAMASKPGRGASVRPVTLSTVLTPRRRENKKKAIHPAMMASARADLSRWPNDLPGSDKGSNLLHLGTAKQTGREKDEDDGEHGEGGNVLVLGAARRIGRPEGLDQADDQPAEHGAR